MGWIEDLSGQTVGLDTAPLIYYIEEHAKYLGVIEPFFEAVKAGDIRLVTSTICLTEVLVQLYRHGDDELADKYNDILLSSLNVLTMPATVDIAQSAARLRGEHGMKAPDAIVMATAMTHDADAFLTNDRDIKKIPGIEIIKLRDL